MARLHHLSHTISFRPFAPAAWIDARDLEIYRRDWRARLRAANEFNAAWVALEGRDVVGMASAIRLPDDSIEGRPTRCRDSLRARSPAADRARHRAPIVDRVRAFLRERGFARARVDTIAANARARRFFEAAGFRLVRIDSCGVEGVPIAIYELELGGAEGAGSPRRGAAARDGS